MSAIAVAAGLKWTDVLLAFLPTAPGLVLQLLATWHTQGKITTQEVADFIGGWPDADSFFPPKPVPKAGG